MIYRTFSRNWQSSGFAKKMDTYKHIKRAIDFNELQAHGEALANDVDPFFIGIFSDEGRLIYFMFCGIPQTDSVSKQTTINAVCLKTIFNTERIIDFSGLNITTLGDLLSVIFTAFLTVPCGFNISIDYTLVSTISITDEDLEIDLVPKTKDIFNIFELLQKLLFFYECNLVYEVSIKEQMVYFIIDRANDEKTILLQNYNIIDDVKITIGINMTQVQKADGSGNIFFYLTRDNRITLNLNDTERLYPALNKVFISEIDDEDFSKTELNYHQAKINAVFTLAERRYQQNFDIPLYPSDRLFAVDFKTKFNVYSDKGFYKQLPLGEIETNHNNVKILRIGYRPQFLTQVI